MRPADQAVRTATWVYVSEASFQGASADAAVDEIANFSRRRNQHLNVTGALLFTGRRFAQWLEGPEKSIADLRQSISRDTSHRLITTICFQHDRPRLFQGWSLAYSGPSRYIARLLDGVELGTDGSMAAVSDDLMRLFAEFAQVEGMSDAPLSAAAPKVQMPRSG